MTSALALNLLSSLLAFLSGAAAKGLYQRRQTMGPARRVWRLRRPDEVVIVQPDGPGHDTPLPTLYEGDAMAAMLVSEYLRKVLRVPTVRIIRAKNFSRCRDAPSDLVVIGGPNANDLYKELDRQVTLPYSFRLYPDRADMIRNSDGHVFAQQVVHAKTTRDFAVISLLPSPFHADRRVIVLAGCGTLGSLAAAKMVTQDGIARLAALRPSAPFSAVIEIEILDGQMTNPQIVDTTA
ncbi:hypothetical protein [Actinomadura decatromicini]|uniref:S-layer protein C-terminal domain-containing protein n=1 Tax=Actinomadura decatromicini TaxID=2604572 RepID=A0A5D3FNH2_9ACTN|nr:hypothetical protein [Actinomadura decatromicini]TYK49568.1 hypothetical protein FXF68_17670 [Actinomadura decatromicini]